MIRSPLDCSSAVLSFAACQDRVEASPEQLAAASSTAERLTKQTGRRTRVVGWVHSHPHITVLPSHVDVATQAAYQQLDASFVGLITSAFDNVRASFAAPPCTYGSMSFVWCFACVQSVADLVAWALSSFAGRVVQNVCSACK